MRCVIREIFGPFLPIIPVDDLEQVIQILNSKYVLVMPVTNLLAVDVASCPRPSPLVIYLFTNQENLKYKCKSIALVAGLGLMFE